MLKQPHKMQHMKLIDRISCALAILRGEVYIETQSKRGRCISVNTRIGKGQLIIELDTYTTEESWESEAVDSYAQLAKNNRVK